MKSLRFPKKILFLLLMGAPLFPLHAQRDDGAALLDSLRQSHPLIDYRLHRTSVMDAPPTSRELAKGNHKWRLDADADAFFFDAEYKLPFALGFSVTGGRLTPAVTYGINRRAQIRAGFRATAFAGLDSLYRLRPLLTVTFQPADWITLIGGTLYGGANHRLDLPLYDPSLYIFDPEEEGIQILMRTRIWESDTWLDWRHYLASGASDQEHFLFGTSHRLLLCSGNRPWSLTTPLTYTAEHHGGQIGTLDTNAVTHFQMRGGLSFQWVSPIAQKGTQRWLADVSLYYHYRVSDVIVDGQGYGLYPTLSYECMLKRKEHDKENSMWKLRATVGFWYGDRYNVTEGAPQFSTLTRYGDSPMGDIRTLITTRGEIEYEFSQMFAGFSFSSYSDLRYQNTDFLFGLYLKGRVRSTLKGRRD